MASIAMPPTSRNRLRSPIDRLVPTTVWISVVSVVSRDSTSPVWVVSKKLRAHLQHMAIHRLPDIRRHPPAEPRNKIETQRRRRRQQQRNAKRK